MMSRFPTLVLWWQARSVREQWLLGILGGVALVALLLVAVVKPLQAARGAALADIRTYQSLATRLRANADAGTAARPMRTGDTAAILSAAAAAQGLAPQIAADGTATLADAPYDATLRWISDVEATSALRLDTLALTPATPGRIAARARFRR
jgi:general secretion pathway protein M